MKAICITHENFSGRPFHEIPKPDIGEEVTIAEELHYYDIPVYKLVEYGPFFLYDRRWFALSSEIDEVQLVREVTTNQNT